MDSFARNNYFDDEVINKQYACDYAHMNSAVKTSDGKYIYISFKHIGIIKLEYATKKLVWIIGPTAKDSLELPNGVSIFAHQHDIHLIDDNNIYFWDNQHLSYTELGVVDNKVVNYKTFKCPTKCNRAVMGNVLKVSDTVIDVCYGLRGPRYSPHIYLQPIVSEIDLTTGQTLVDLTI